MARGQTLDGTPSEKKLLKNEAQFEVRELKDLKLKTKKKYWVYDKKRGCYPRVWPEYGGKIAQDLETPEEAQAEADRLNILVGITPDLEPTKAEKSRKKNEAKKPAKLDSEPEPVEEEELPELADYGVMSKEERAKYEEGLLEEVKY